eukprot:COSAG02_NODE_71_length_42019_cov_36.443893_16_plen_69_part_00
MYWARPLWDRAVRDTTDALTVPTDVVVVVVDAALVAAAELAALTRKLILYGLDTYGMTSLRRVCVSSA